MSLFHDSSSFFFFFASLILISAQTLLVIGRWNVCNFKNSCYQRMAYLKIILIVLTKFLIFTKKYNYNFTHNYLNFVSEGVANCHLTSQNS